MVERMLSQDEIDSVFRSARHQPADDAAKRAEPFDFRRPDRIAKDQLRAIHLLHDGFARSLASSLSAYLRAYVVVNLVSVEQISFREFSQGLPSPTCLVSLGMKPYDGMAVLELNPSLVFPVLEMLLGGDAKVPAKLTRELTEIERSILEGIFRILLNDLRAAWQGVAPIQFRIESHENEPQLLQVLAPNEAVVAIAMEVRVGENVGMMNLGIPSIVVKMLRNRFDQQWSVRRSETTEAGMEKLLRLLMPARVRLDARLQGPTVLVSDLLRLAEGDVLTFDHRTDRPVDLLVNGAKRYEGRVGVSGHRRVFRADTLLECHE